MHIAKSMYKGGIVVYADDDFLNYSSYFDLGLLCLGCNNDVIIKDGKKKRKHFSHRKAISEREKQCVYRTSSINKMLGGNFTEIARNQRRDIFQEYLLQFVARSHRDFYQKIRNKGELSRLESFIREYTSYYHEVESSFVTYCRQIKGKPSGVHEELRVLEPR